MLSAPTAYSCCLTHQACFAAILASALRPLDLPRALSAHATTCRVDKRDPVIHAAGLHGHVPDPVAANSAPAVLCPKPLNAPTSGTCAPIHADRHETNTAHETDACPLASGLRVRYQSANSTHDCSRARLATLADAVRLPVHVLITECPRRRHHTHMCTTGVWVSVPPLVRIQLLPLRCLHRPSSKNET